jgi:hypothetical protein
MTTVPVQLRSTNLSRKLLGICITCCIGFAAVFAVTLPNGGVGHCLSLAECSMSMREVWHDILAPLTAALLIGLTATFGIIERGGTRLGVLAGLLVALLTVALMMLLALGHNPQGSYCEIIREGSEYQCAQILGVDPPCAIQWHNWLYIGFAWTIVTFPVALIVYGMIWLGKRNGERGNWPDT